MGGKSAEQTQGVPAASGFSGQPYSATMPAGQPGQLEALAAQLQAGGYPVSLDDLQKMYAPTSVKSYQPLPGMGAPQPQGAPAAPAPAAPVGLTMGGPMGPYDSMGWSPNANRR